MPRGTSIPFLFPTSPIHHCHCPHCLQLPWGALQSHSCPTPAGLHGELGSAKESDGSGKLVPPSCLVPLGPPGSTSGAGAGRGNLPTVAAGVLQLIPWQVYFPCWGWRGGARNRIAATPVVPHPFYKILNPSMPLSPLISQSFLGLVS